MEPKPQTQSSIPKEIVIFISSFSKNSIPVVSFLNSHGLTPFIKIVRADTAEIRKTLSSGSKFQITKVPCLLVEYSDKKIQLFETAPKIIQWLMNYYGISEPKKTPQPFSMTPKRLTLEESASPSVENSMTGLYSAEVESGLKFKSIVSKDPETLKKTSLGGRIKQEFNEEQPETDAPETETELLQFNETHEDIPIIAPSKKRKYTKKKVIEGLTLGKPTSENNLHEAAKKMAQERNQLLGIEN